MNKKWIASLACVCLLASSFTAAVAEGMKPGTYTEVARGMYDGLTVDVTVSESKIEDIKVTAYNETAPGWPALEKMPAAILEAQSLAVDTVSGATRTSEGILKAVEAALVEAGANVEDFKKPVEAKEVAAPDYFPTMGSVEVPEKWDESYDVVVVGGGFAGLAAASCWLRSSPPPAATAPSTAASTPLTPPSAPPSSSRSWVLSRTPPRSTSKTPSRAATT